MYATLFFSKLTFETPGVLIKYLWKITRLVISNIELILTFGVFILLLLSSYFSISHHKHYLRFFKGMNFNWLTVDTINLKLVLGSVSKTKNPYG